MKAVVNVRFVVACSFLMGSLFFAVACFAAVSTLQNHKCVTGRAPFTCDSAGNAVCSDSAMSGGGTCTYCPGDVPFASKFCAGLEGYTCVAVRTTVPCSSTSTMRGTCVSGGTPSATCAYVWVDYSSPCSALEATCL